MKKFFYSFILAFCTNFAFAQNFNQDFQECFKQRDQKCQLNVLNKWEKLKTKSAEFYINYFNYYLNKSVQSGISISTNKPQGEHVELTNTDDGKKAYIGENIAFEKAGVKKAIEKISVGIEKYPQRLDMHFGKIHIFSMIEDWQSFKNEIIKVIDYSKKIDNQWFWSENEKLENGKEFFLQGIVDYQVTIFEKFGESGLADVYTIANHLLKYYPDNVASITNVANYHLQKNNLNKALKFLLRAEKVDPSDPIVLVNIAYLYKIKNHKNQAILYYKKLLRQKDDYFIKLAQENIKDLQAN